MNEKMTLIAILVAAACTFLMRALPFTLLGRKREVPKKIRYLGRILPSAIMAVLVIYCVRDITTDFSGKGIREIIAVVCCAGIHIWRKNTLLSILVSTGIYIALSYIIV